MALFEFHCQSCNKKFEELRSSTEAKSMPDCPKCGSSKQVSKLISRFAVGGQGDLRETTIHGCHEYTGGPDHDHGHGQGGHDHSHED